VFEKARQTQDQVNEMTSSISLLLMHDAIELLMVAVLDHLNAPVNDRREFMEFWSAVEKESKKVPPDKGRMQSLNKARVALKHHGVMPDPKEIRDMVPRVEGFFENVLREFCDVDYAAVSLSDLLQDELVRQLIAEARNNFARGEKTDAMTQLAYAFDRLNHPDGQRLPLLRTPPKPQLARVVDNRDNRTYVDHLYRYFSECTAQINALTLGIDRTRWSRFHFYMPSVLWSLNGTPHTQLRSGYYDKLSVEEFEDCISFLVDYGIRAGELYIVDLPRKSKRQYKLSSNSNNSHR
jgi:hypothetical protein